MTRREWLGSATAGALPGRLQASQSARLTIESFALYVCRVDPRPWVLIELRTAEGLTGLGDATSSGWNRSRTPQAAHLLLDAIRGRSPFEIERLRSLALSMVSAADPSERRSTAAVCSGMEQCMWDLQGKALDLPCFELFGGKLRDRIRNYANINRATRGAQRTPEGFATNAAKGVDAGLDAFKLAPFDHLRRSESDPTKYEEGVRQAIRFLESVRAAIGPDRDLLIDGHSRFSLSQAVELLPRLAPFNLYWLEEMCRETADLAHFNTAASTRTAGGESIWSVHQFAPYIQAGAVDIVMPDVKYCGGMFELKKIAAMAEAAGLATAPHGPASPIGNVAAAHVCATLPNFDVLELAYGEVPWRADTVRPPEEIHEGHLTLSNRPGLGYEMNPRYWERRAG